MNPIKPTRPQADPADQWVKTRKSNKPAPATIRMTFDIDSELHHQFIMAAARRREKLSVALRAFVVQYITETGKLP